MEEEEIVSEHRRGKGPQAKTYECKLVEYDLWKAS